MRKKSNLLNDHHDHDEATHHQGLVRDLERMTALRLSRRGMLGLLGGASLLPFVGCLGSDDSSSGSDAGTGGSGADAGADDGTCSTIPEETGGPYPGDGSNGANALALSGIVRSDIRASIAGATGVAAGVPLTVKLKLVDTSAGCAPLAGYAIYLWHCDRDGNYSMYSSAVVDQNYLRGVQETDDDGTVTFTTIFPACYSGRWPHIHFEIYPSLASATSSPNKLRTSQLALPEDVCDVVFAESGYAASVSNLGKVTLASDNVFSDGASTQLPSVTGSVAEGYVASLTVGIAS